MARTLSTMTPLGTAAPNFDLPELLRGGRVRLEDFTRHPALLVMFICAHCPFVQHVESELAQLGNESQRRGVGVIAISSNDAASYADDNPDGLRAQGRRLGFEFPYAYDEDQVVARTFGAACTPDFFVYDQHHHLAYRGEMDASRPGNAVPVTGNELRAALDALLAGHRPAAVQRPSIGCSIKWKEGAGERAASSS